MVWLIAAVITAIVILPALDLIMGILLIILSLVLLALFLLTFLQQEDKMKPLF